MYDLTTPGLKLKKPQSKIYAKICQIKKKILFSTPTHQGITKCMFMMFMKLSIKIVKFTVPGQTIQDTYNYCSHDDPFFNESSCWPASIDKREATVRRILDYTCIYVQSLNNRMKQYKHGTPCSPWNVPLSHFLCVHCALTVHSLALSALFSLTIYKALTMHSQSIHLALIVYSAFTYCSVRYYYKDPALQDYSDQSCLSVYQSFSPSVHPRSLVRSTSFFPLTQSGSCFTHIVLMGYESAVILDRVSRSTVEVTAELYKKSLSRAYLILSPWSNLTHTSLTECLWSQGVQ